jgi:prophage regulatory protein
MLRLAQVIERTGLKKTKIYELQSEGQFPMRVKITARAVGWIEHEVQAWLSGRVAKNNPLRSHGSRA